MPKFLITVSMSAMHVWHLTDTFEGADEKEAQTEAEKYIQGLSTESLKAYSDGLSDHHTQIEGSEEVKA